MTTLIYEIYTDASFRKSDNLSVSGYCVCSSYTQPGEKRIELSNIQLHQSREINNIRAEVQGAIKALRDFKQETSDCKIILYTDCQTVSGLLARRQKLEDKNFISQTKGTSLANADLYKEFYQIYDSLKPEIVWVKGHSKKSTATVIEKNFSLLDKTVRHQLRQI